MRVMVVDDEKALRELFGQILEEEGHEVCLAASGEEALELLGTEPQLDVLLVDFSMPLMSGADFLKIARVKYGETLSRARVMGFSSYAEGIPLLADFERVTDKVLEKPIDLDQFTEMIRVL